MVTAAKIYSNIILTIIKYGNTINRNITKTMKEIVASEAFKRADGW